MVPVKIFKSGSIYAIVSYCFLTRFSMLLFSYYIPIFYQAVRHKSATTSGVAILPFMMGTVLSMIIAGQTVAFHGRYWPFLVASPVFLAVGSGLLYTLTPSTSSASLVGFQILCGVGIGLGMQNAIMAMQVEFKDTPALISQSTSMASFAQFLGGTIGLGVAEPVFSSELTKNLLKYAPEAPAMVVKESPVNIYTELPASEIAGVVQAYARSLKVVYVVGVPIAILGLLAALGIKNIKIEKTKIKKGEAPASAPAPADADAEKGVEVEEEESGTLEQMEARASIEV